LAGGMDLPTSVAPFILRGISLLGIDSVMRPRADRELAWKRLEGDLDRGKLADVTSEIGLGEVIDAARRIVEGRVRGRIAVKIG
jgi:acrylyl-CoA reductase (NADPH)